MATFDDFAQQLRSFSDRNAAINEIRKDLRKEVPDLRSRVRANAKATLPSRGGLGAWVARSSFTIRFKDSGRAAGVSIKVSRKNSRGLADLADLDEVGQVRHPLYGNRRHWYGQAVPPGFFSKIFDQTKWLAIAETAFDRAIRKFGGS